MEAEESKCVGKGIGRVTPNESCRGSEKHVYTCCNIEESSSRQLGERTRLLFMASLVHRRLM